MGCKGDEITWRSDKPGKKNTCIPCIDCPDGTEPSIPCGGTAKYGTHLHCEACRQGTYSDNYGKGPCKPCSLCSVGRTATRNCSATKNAQCGSCKYGYYQKVVIMNLLFYCLPCSVCCGDGKDKVEKQCTDQGLPSQQHCKLRTAPSCQLLRTTSKITSSTSFLGANHTAKKGTSPKGQSEEASSVPSSRTPKPYARTTAITAKRHEKLAASQYGTSSASEGFLGNKSKGSFSDRSVDINNGNGIIVSPMYGIPVIFIAIIVIVLKRNKLASFFERTRCGPILRCRDAELGKQIESTPLDVVPLGGR